MRPVWWSAIALLLGAACAGELEDPARFTAASGEESPSLPADAGVEPAGTDAGGTPGVACPSEIDVETDIFAATCGKSSCHSAETSAGGLDLASPNVKDRLLDVDEQGGCGRPLVSTREPALSAILDRLTLQPRCGLSMPIGAPLSSVEVGCVAAWVEAAVASSTTSEGDAE